MNYREPRQRKDGRWDYTCRNNDRVWPEGYCAGRTEGGHTDGHATPEEAVACYGRYLLDHRLGFGANSVKRECVECGEWTTGIATIGGWLAGVYCAEHQSREVVERHWKPPASSVSST